MSRHHRSPREPTDATAKLALIAKRVREAGAPLASCEAVPGWFVFRFGGPRAQTVHADPNTADASSVIAAYLRPPPDVVIDRGRAE